MLNFIHTILESLSTQSQLLDNLRNIATIIGSVVIPLAIFLSARSRERKRASLDLLRLFNADSTITAWLARLYAYRRFEQETAAGFPDFLDLVEDIARFQRRQGRGFLNRIRTVTATP